MGDALFPLHDSYCRLARISDALGDQIHRFYQRAEKRIRNVHTTTPMVSLT